MFAYYRAFDWPEMQRRARAFLPPLENEAPHLVEEMHGIAAGAGVQFEEILALNTRIELLAGSSFALRHSNFDAAMARNRRLGVPTHPASDGAAADEGPNKCRFADSALHPVERVEAVCGIVMHVAGAVMHIACDAPARTLFEAVAV
jgi:hypothetical protein